MSPAPKRRKAPPELWESRFSEFRDSWVRFHFFELARYRGTYTPTGVDADAIADYAEGENPEHVTLFIRKTTGRVPQVPMVLTSLTEQELLAFRYFVNESIDQALPIAAENDRRAREAFESGDGAFSRLYREVPRIYVRDGESRKYREVVPERPGEPADLGTRPRYGDRERSDPAGVPDNGGVPVAEHSSGGVGAEDDQSQADGDTVVRSVGNE